MLLAPTQSAWAEKPHLTHTNLVCVWRFSAAVCRHRGHLRLVFWGDTGTRRPPPLPLRLVRQLAAQFEPACVQNRTVESRLLANPLSRPCLRALGGGRHILYRKVLDKHDGVVFADVVRRLVWR